MANKDSRELFITGYNVTSRQVKYLHKKGEVKQLEKGIYIRSDLSEENMMKKYSMRIFNHVYKNSYFSNVTAYTGTPVEDTIFMKGGHITKRSNAGTNIAHFKNHFKFPDTKDILLKDPIGEFVIKVSSDIQQVMECTESYKGYPNSCLNNKEIESLMFGIMKQYGGYDEAMSAIYNFADKNDIVDRYKQLESKVSFLSNKNVENRKPRILHDFELRWHNKKFGSLDYDGTGWNFSHEDGWILPMSLSSVSYKQLPSFIESMLPEVVIGNKSDAKNIIGLLKNGKRYLSNIVMFDKSDNDLNKDYVEDMLEGRAKDFSNEFSVFEGSKSSIPNRDSRFEINVGRLLSKKIIPKISGAQIKMPAFLSYDGELTPVLKNEPFTHILKMPGSSGHMHLGLLEWLALKGLEFSGIEIAETSLINIEDIGHKPAVISERFDIKTSLDDNREIFCEDLSSVMNVISDNKYTKSAEEIGRAVIKHSTIPNEDARFYLKQVAASWFVGNGDFHLKNLVFIKEKDALSKDWDSIKLSPAFDVIATSVLHSMDHKNHFGLDGETFGIKVNGKNFGLDIHDFIALGRMIGIKKSETTDILTDMAKDMYSYTSYIDSMLPDFVKEKDSMITNINEFKSLIKHRVTNFGLDTKFSDELKGTPKDIINSSIKTNKA